MITLYLLRHAKSGWDNPDLADIDRPLARRGQREAAELAALIGEKGYRPARILCSTAQRTRETLAALLPALAAETDVRLDRRLYAASPEKLLELVHMLGEDAPSLMVIGHNPGLELLAAALVGQGDPDAHARLAAKFPPAGLAVIGFDVDRWEAVEAGTGRLSAFHTPRA